MDRSSEFPRPQWGKGTYVCTHWPLSQCTVTCSHVTKAHMCPDSGVRWPAVQIQELPLSSCVTLDKLPKLSKSQLAHVEFSHVPGCQEIAQKCTCCPDVITYRASFYSQKCPRLDDNGMTAQLMCLYFSSKVAK